MKLVLAVFHVLLLSGLAWWLLKNEKSSLRKAFLPALIFKLTAGIFLGLVYTYYYTVGDTFQYFHDAALIADLAADNFISYSNFLFSGKEVNLINKLGFLEPRALLLSKIVSIFCLATANNYWIISLYFSFFSFLSSWFLVRQIARYDQGQAMPAVIAFLFFPSIVFWTSGVIKESLAMSGIYFLSALFLKFWNNERIRFIDGVLGLMLLWLSYSLKYYFVAVFMPVVCAGIFFKLTASWSINKKPLIQIMWWCLLFIVPLAIVTSLRPNFYPGNILQVIVSNYNAFQSSSAPGDVVHYFGLQATWLSVLQNAPWAFLSGVLRPFLWEAGNPLQFFIGLENLLLLILILFAIRNVRSLGSTPNMILILSIMVYVLLLSVFISLSTPNFGTLSRYRVGFLPYFVFLILCKNPVLRFVQTSFQRLAL